ncbi:MAG: hypothetical protein LQ352_006007 [Teloschistes flavicans]|nr:MAG: hypothetical protein LQ352_006007 [Teloschistes flavicans]
MAISRATASVLKSEMKVPSWQFYVSLLVLGGSNPESPSDVGPNYIQLEPCVSLSIPSKPCGWSTEYANEPCIQLAPSTSSRKVLCFLRPDDSFKIGHVNFLLQAQPSTVEQEPVDQEIQVKSSRPGSVDEQDVKDTGPETNDRLATPSLSAGAAILETPVANRYEPRPKAPPVSANHTGGARSRKRTVRRHRRSPSLRFPEELDVNPEMTAPTSPREDQAAVKDGGAAGDTGNPNGPSSTEEIPASSVNGRRSTAGHQATDPNPAQTSPEKNQSSLTTNLSAPELLDADPEADAQSSAWLSFPKDLRVRGNFRGRGNLRKRTASHIDVVNTDDQVTQSASSKRRRRDLTSNVVPDTSTESQNSIKSTIDVEVPEEPPVQASVAESESSPMDEDKEPAQQADVISPSKEVESTPRNRIKSTETPSSSARSTRPSARKHDLRVVYASTTTIEESTAYGKFLRQQNVKAVKNVKDCDILCVGKGELKRTSNLILAVLLGKDIVTDDWIIQSAKKDHMLDTSAFIPKDAAREREWGFSLADAIARGRQGKLPFEGWIINFTPTAKKELGQMWKELKDVCLAAGAESVEARKIPARVEGTIVVAAAAKEPDGTALKEAGWKMYSKDIVTFSALRGELDPDSKEFLVEAVVGKTKKEKGSAAGGKKKR